MRAQQIRLREPWMGQNLLVITTGLVSNECPCGVLELLILQPLNDRGETLTSIGKIREFVEDDDPILVTKLARSAFPILFNLSNAWERLGCDIDELVEWYLRCCLHCLVDDCIVSVRELLLDELRRPEVSTTENDDNLGFIGRIAAP